MPMSTAIKKHIIKLYLCICGFSISAESLMLVAEGSTKHRRFGCLEPIMVLDWGIARVSSAHMLSNDCIAGWFSPETNNLISIDGVNPEDQWAFSDPQIQNKFIAFHVWCKCSLPLSWYNPATWCVGINHTPWAHTYLCKLHLISTSLAYIPPLWYHHVHLKQPSVMNSANRLHKLVTTLPHTSSKQYKPRFLWPSA